MNWSWLTSIFGYFYNFFMGIYSSLNVPANAINQEWSFYNPYLDLTVSGGVPHVLADVLNTLLDVLVNWWAEPLLNAMGLTLNAPVWSVLLSFLPSIMIIVILVQVFIKWFNNIIKP